MLDLDTMGDIPYHSVMMVVSAVGGNGRWRGLEKRSAGTAG